jgi:hypothetical protein
MSDKTFNNLLAENRQLRQESRSLRLRLKKAKLELNKCIEESRTTRERLGIDLRARFPEQKIKNRGALIVKMSNASILVLKHSFAHPER